jgi:hypothetical protein
MRLIVIVLAGLALAYAIWCWDDEPRAKLTVYQQINYLDFSRDPTGFEIIAELIHCGRRLVTDDQRAVEAEVLRLISANEISYDRMIVPTLTSEGDPGRIFRVVFEGEEPYITACSPDVPWCRGDDHIILVADKEEGAA